jgi:membrane-associated protein
MDAILEFFRSLHGDHLRELIQWGGFALLFAIVFAETGLLVGFFLPGDSLLFTAGALVGAGILKAPAPLPNDPMSSLIALNLVLITAAIVGDSVGYWFGRKTGPPLFNRPNSRLFKQEHLRKAQQFYEKHGSRTIILARWVPFARTFAPILAGVAGMRYSTFMTYNVVGGITWVVGCTFLGYFLGSLEWVREHNEKVILIIVALSVLPVFLHALKERREHLKARAAGTSSGGGVSSSAPDTQDYDGRNGRAAPARSSETPDPGEPEEFAGAEAR